MFKINIPLDTIINTQPTQPTQQTQPTNIGEDGVPKYRRYWPVPPLIQSVYEYQDVNKDVYLRKDVTQFFHQKIIKWINEDSEYSKHKSKLGFLNSVDGQMHIYNLLRKFVKKSGINWYDLRDNYQIIKEYLNKKI